MMPLETCGYTANVPEAEVDYNAAASSYDLEMPYGHSAYGRNGTYALTGYAPVNQNGQHGNYAYR